MRSILHRNLQTPVTVPSSQKSVPAWHKQSSNIPRPRLCHVSNQTT